MKELCTFRYNEIKVIFNSEQNEMTITNENNTRITIKAWWFDTSAIRYLYPNILAVINMKQEFEKIEKVSDIPQIVSICKKEIMERCLDIERMYYHY